MPRIGLAATEGRISGGRMMWTASVRIIGIPAWAVGGREQAGFSSTSSAVDFDIALSVVMLLLPRQAGQVLAMKRSRFGSCVAWFSIDLPESPFPTNT